RRRGLQMDHNIAHAITPTTVKSSIKDIMETVYEKDHAESFPKAAEPELAFADLEELRRKIMELEKEMSRAAEELNFEEAARFRDLVRDLKERELQCL
ncbi:MAG: UvrB/UvrC motif-containing protein, partial [Thermodesulfobacteriota bacterium]